MSNISRNLKSKSKTNLKSKSKSKSKPKSNSKSKSKSKSKSPYISTIKIFTPVKFQRKSEILESIQEKYEDYFGDNLNFHDIANIELRKLQDKFSELRNDEHLKLDLYKGDESIGRKIQQIIGKSTSLKYISHNHSNNSSIISHISINQPIWNFHSELSALLKNKNINTSSKLKKQIITTHKLDFYLVVFFRYLSEFFDLMRMRSATEKKLLGDLGVLVSNADLVWKEINKNFSELLKLGKE
jgi:hypothetical protein